MESPLSFFRMHWDHEPWDRAVASWTAPVLWRFWLARLHCQSARGLSSFPENTPARHRVFHEPLQILVEIMVGSFRAESNGSCTGAATQPAKPKTAIFPPICREFVRRCLATGLSGKDERGLAHSKTWRGLRRFMESLLPFFRMHWDHEPRASETAPPRCCRHLAGSAFLRLVCRQDAGSTLDSWKVGYSIAPAHAP